MDRKEEAVTAVVGVVIMIAITVVLAAVVYVLADQLRQNEEPTPRLGVLKNQGEKSLYVAVISWNGDPIPWTNSTADTTGLLVEGCTGTLPALASPGDTITGCSGTVRIVYLDAGTMVYTTDF